MIMLVVLSMWWDDVNIVGSLQQQIIMVLNNIGEGGIGYNLIGLEFCPK